jgi:apolipoprotein D and lipocalin family protein
MLNLLELRISLGTREELVPRQHSTICVVAFALLLAGVVPSCAQTQKPLTAVVTLKPTRIAGTWYEIARYPYNKEKHCVSDAQELIAPGYKPHQLLLVDACKTKAGYTQTRNLAAVAPNAKDPGAFKVRTFWPFWRKYWVLALSPDYSWTLLGSPDHKTLWIFSKSPALSADVLSGIEAQAAAKGFPASRLILSPHTHLIAGNGPTIPTHRDLPSP